MSPTLQETEAFVRSKIESPAQQQHMADVAAGVRHLDEDTQHTAWLHDIVEDTDVTVTELISRGYPTEVIDAVCLLTRPVKMSYADYIDQLISSGNRMAIAVKLSDNIDNTRFDRLNQLNHYAVNALLKRYNGVKEKLIASLDRR